MFRRSVRLDPTFDEPLGLSTTAWQEADFAALDTAWRSVAGVPLPSQASASQASASQASPLQPESDSPTSLRRAWIERPRGHAKTGDMAVQIAWALLFARRSLRGIAAAADREQAGLVADAVRTLCQANPSLCARLRFRQNVIDNPSNGARLDLISSDVASSFGLTPDFIICDELCHWQNEGLWHSLASAAAKKPHCLLAVLTNAGSGRGWQWKVRETARLRPDWHFSTLDGCQAPWIRADDLAEQRALLPPSVFDRLWNNRWQDAAGDFVTAAEVAACRDAVLHLQSRGRPGVRYFAAIDYAEKHDLTAAIVLHRETDRLVVDRLDVAVPTSDRPVLVAWVEDWIAKTAAAFGDVTFVADEYQLLGMLQSLERRYRILRFPFAAGKGNHELALLLRRLVVHRQIAWYAGCGARSDDPADDLERELASLVVRESSQGMLRFDHPPGGHDDRAFVLAAATWLALNSPTNPTRWSVTPPHRGLLREGW